LTFETRCDALGCIDHQVTFEHHAVYRQEVHDAVQ